MDPDRIDIDSIVRALYRAAAGQERFEAALGMMMAPLRETMLGAQMIGLDAVRRSLTFSRANLTTPAEAEADLEYMRKYHTVDPRIPLLVDREPNHWLWCEDEFPGERALNEPYYRDLLIPVGGRHSGTAKVLQDEHDIVLIGVFSKLGGPGFTPEVRAYLERMGAHLSEALSIHRHVRALATGHSVGVELIERLNKPAWVLSDRREIHGLNSLARTAMERGTPFRELGGRLCAFARNADNQLAAAMAGLEQRANAGEAGPRAALKLAAGGEPYVASVALFEPQRTMHAFGHEPRFLLMLHVPARPAEPDVYLWQVAFELTPAEGRIAAAIFRGTSLREAAAALGISLNTANTQLDHVYAKTGVHGKVALVQLLRSIC